jgi:hypothetical protein
MSRKVLKEYGTVDEVNTWEENGEWNYRGRAYEEGGKEYPHSNDGVHKQGKLRFNAWSGRDESFKVNVDGGSVEVSGDLGCIEYEDDEEPGTKFIWCDIRSDLPSLERDLFYEEPIRERVGKKIADAVDKKASKLVAETPETVYHKTDLKGLVGLLKRGFWSRDRLSTSYEHLERCDLFTPTERQQVSLHFKIPDEVCPIKLDYEPENFRGLLPEKERYQAMNKHVDVAPLYTIARAKELTRRYPACANVDPDIISGMGTSSTQMETEKEIFLTVPDGNEINVRDVIEIIVETQCGANIDVVKEALEKEGLGHLVSKVRSG